MAANESFDWRQSDRRLFAAVALIFPLIILIGFARTYYLKAAFDTSPVPSLLVHAHGLVMTAWVFYFVAQVWLIRSRKARVHMRAGMLGIALAIVVLVVGFFTAAAAAFGSASAPPDIPPLSFMIVPMTDLVMFAGLFGAAIYYRKRPAHHKRLMLLTVINFLPPAIARIPIESFQAMGPLFFFGAPTVIIIGLLIYDSWRNRRLDRVFLVGSIVLIASYPIRLMVMGTSGWLNFAAWITSWAA
ncbi:hypothetical protein BH20ACI2_BH20ACI2_09740 [soil metagenome]